MRIRCRRCWGGGMGEVYRARDTKLQRDVAVKFLPQAFTSDPERLSRFEGEARMLAALNHPNIGAIYGLEEAKAFASWFSSSWTGKRSRTNSRMSRANAVAVPGSPFATR